jgi:hypothetical protein
MCSANILLVVSHALVVSTFRLFERETKGTGMDSTISEGTTLKFHADPCTLYFYRIHIQHVEPAFFKPSWPRKRHTVLFSDSISSGGTLVWPNILRYEG